MYIYSPEALPNMKLMGHPMYNPEFIRVHGGINLSVGENEWIEVPDTYRLKVHRDWVDKAGKIEHVHLRDRLPHLKKLYGPRGVFFLDEKPDPKSKVALETEAKEKNLAFRRQIVEEYEAQVREKQVTGFGRTQPTPYEEECYDILGQPRPFSVEAMRAQRHPGEESAERIATAIERVIDKKLPKSDKSFPASPGGA